MSSEQSTSPAASRGDAPQGAAGATNAAHPAFVDVTEQQRLNEARERDVPWKRWGPYSRSASGAPSARTTATDGDAWDYFSHDQARSRAYRWGEDGIGGISDDKQRLCFALALWNGRDPILKERLFGLTNSEGNHGEDVKEYYFYLDSTPTHSYMRYLYKYPQREFPYARPRGDEPAAARSEESEYELLDTGVFDGDRYFDVVVEYAKAGPEDMLVRDHGRTTAGPRPRRLHLLPTLWFRNTWSWKAGDAASPRCAAAAGRSGVAPRPRRLRARVRRRRRELLFTENESNDERLWGQPNASPWVKDAFHGYVVARHADAVNPARTGTKAAARYAARRAGGRLVRGPPAPRRPRRARRTPFGDAFDATFDARLADADEFYERITPPSLTEDERRVHRQALAGMLWSKQYYLYDVDTG